MPSLSRSLKVVTAGSLLLAGMSLNPFLLLKLQEGIPSRLIASVFMLVFAGGLPFRRGIRFSVPVVAILWLQILVLFFLELYHSNSEGGANYIFTAVTLMVVLIAYLVIENDPIVLREFVHGYVLLMVIMLVLAAVSVVLAYFGKVEPHAVYDRGTSGLGGSVVYSIGLTFSNEILKVGDGFLVRPSGLFDEPGMFGIYVMLALLANAVVLHNKWYEFLLIVFGFFTTSLGFFVSVFLYLLFWRRKIWFVACSIFVIAVLIGVFSGQQAEGSILYLRTIGRVLELFGTNVGGNREASSIEGAAMLLNAGPWGMKAHDLVEYSDIQATFFGPFLLYGLIGGGMLYMHILLLGVTGVIQERGDLRRLFGNNSVRVFIVMAISLYHRPFCLFFLYYLLLLAIFVKERRERVNPAVPSFVGVPVSS